MVFISRFDCTFVSDPYKFDVSLSSDRVSGNSVDLSWSGVPMPHQKYVNLYRVMYQEADTLRNGIPGADASPVRAVLRTLM